MSAGETLTLSPPRKRPAPEDDDAVFTPHKILKSDALSLDKDLVTPVASPGTAQKPNSTPAQSSTSNPVSTTPSNGQKKPKRSKEEIEKEKAQKEAEKLAKAQEREEKKRQKLEEDKIKQAERDAKKEEREKEKQEKELEKQRKIEEKEKKERLKLEEQEKRAKAQPKLNSFFNSKPSVKAVIREQKPDTTDPLVSTTSSAAIQPSKSEYETTFLSFALPTHGYMASPRRVAFGTAEESTLDPEEIPVLQGTPTIPYARRHGNDDQPSVRDILDALQGSVDNPIDLTTDAPILTKDVALLALPHVKLTYLEFPEDVRPPYCGTWTKHISSADLYRLPRRPGNTQLSCLSYEYDSEAEWEEPEEGEDIGSDAGDDDSDDGEDDLDGFIDDENNVDPLAAKRPSYIRDLQPVCSGLQWQDSTGKLRPASSSSPEVEWNDLEMGSLLGNTIFYPASFVLTSQVPTPKTIDPFSTQYWTAPMTVSPQKSALVSGNTGLTPQRLALADKTRKINGVNPLAPQLFKVKSLIPPEDMAAFKAAIDGQDLTKIAMVEHLKKLFPKSNKDSISHTLLTVAERESKKPNAKWHLKA